MKRRRHGRFSAAINRIKQQLSERTCADIVGRSPSLVRKWADPDSPAVPNLGQALALDEAYVKSGAGEPPIVNCYADRLRRAIEGDNHHGMDVVLAALTLQAAVGDLSAALVAAKNDDRVDEGKITAEVREKLLTYVRRLDADTQRIEDFLVGDVRGDEK